MVPVVALAYPTGKRKDEDQLHQEHQQVTHRDGNEFQVSDSGDGQRCGVFSYRLRRPRLPEFEGWEKWVCLWELTLTLS